MNSKHDFWFLPFLMYLIYANYYQLELDTTQTITQNENNFKFVVEIPNYYELDDVIIELDMFPPYMASRSSDNLNQVNPFLLVSTDSDNELEVEYKETSHIVTSSTIHNDYYNWLIENEFRTLVIPSAQLVPELLIGVENIPFKNCSNEVQTFQYEITVKTEYDSICTTDCSGAGNCIGGHCYCEANKGGDNCDLNIETLENGIQVEGNIEAGESMYYLFTVAEATSQDTADVVLKIKKESGIITILGKERAKGYIDYPSFGFYSEIIEATSTDPESYEIDLEIGKFSKTYILAIYNSHESATKSFFYIQYSIKVELEDSELYLWLIIILGIIGLIILWAVVIIVKLKCKKRRNRSSQYMQDLPVASTSNRGSASNRNENSADGLNINDLEESYPARTFYDCKLIFIQRRNLKGLSKNCTICLEDFKESDQCRIFYCYHVFHKDCIDKWIQQHNECPLCKKNISEIESEEMRNHNSYGSSIGSSHYMKVLRASAEQILRSRKMRLKNNLFLSKEQENALLKSLPKAFKYKTKKKFPSLQSNPRKKKRLTHFKLETIEETITNPTFFTEENRNRFNPNISQISNCDLMSERDEGFTFRERIPKAPAQSETDFISNNTNTNMWSKEDSSLVSQSNKIEDLSERESQQNIKDLQFLKQIHPLVTQLDPSRNNPFIPSNHFPNSNIETNKFLHTGENPLDHTLESANLTLNPTYKPTSTLQVVNPIYGSQFSASMDDSFYKDMKNEISTKKAKTSESYSSILYSEKGKRINQFLNENEEDSHPQGLGTPYVFSPKYLYYDKAIHEERIHQLIKSADLDKESEILVIENELPE